MLALDILQASRFTPESAQIIQLGAADLRRTQQFDPINYFGIDGKYALHAVAKAYLPYSKARLRPTSTRNHDAFKRLQSFLVTFFDLHMHANAVAGNKGRKIGAQC